MRQITIQLQLNNQTQTSQNVTPSTSNNIKLFYFIERSQKQP